MAFNPFIGWTQPELETELRRAQEDLAAGKTITSASAGDASGSHTLQYNPTKRIEMIYKALNLLDSTTYPMANITRQKAVTVRFRDDKVDNL